MDIPWHRCKRAAQNSLSAMAIPLLFRCLEPTLTQRLALDAPNAAQAQPKCIAIIENINTILSSPCAQTQLLFQAASQLHSNCSFCLTKGTLVQRPEPCQEMDVQFSGVLSLRHTTTAGPCFAPDCSKPTSSSIAYITRGGGASACDKQPANEDGCGTRGDVHRNAELSGWTLATFVGMVLMLLSIKISRFAAAFKDLHAMIHVYVERSVLACLWLGS